MCESEVAGIELQINKAQTALDKLYEALETRLLEMSDLAPRIKSTRNQLASLEQAKFDLLAMISTPPAEPLTPLHVKHYAKELREILFNGTLVEKKSMLRSFIKEIRYDNPELIVEYTLPIAPDGVQPFEREVLYGQSW